MFVWDQWSRILICDGIDYAYQHGWLPAVRPNYRDFIAHVGQQGLGASLESSLLREEIYIYIM